MLSKLVVLLLSLVSSFLLSAQDAPVSKLHPALKKIEANQKISVIIWGKGQADVSSIHRELEWQKSLVDRLDVELGARRKRLDIAVARPQDIEKQRDQALIAYRREVARRVDEELQPGRTALKGYLQSIGIQDPSPLPLVNAWGAEVDGGLLSVLESSVEVSYVSPNLPMKLQLYRSSVATGAPAFWEAGLFGGGESIAIIDSGIDPNHPMFAGLEIEAKVFGRNGSQNPCLADDPNSSFDYHGHGTHVASIAAGRPYQWSDTWFAGVAPGIGKLYALKVGFRSVRRAGSGCEDGWPIDTRDWVDALAWLGSETATRIVNMSLGGLPDNLQVDNTNDLFFGPFYISISRFEYCGGCGE